ncbi:MAG: DUF4476 domain-containing protein [Chitinophagaceae bacterium]
MKSLFILLVSFLTGSTVFSQAGSVTIKVTGNRITQVAVDNQYYTIDNTSSTAEKAFTITSLSTGQHSLEIVRKTRAYGAATNSTTTSFNLRDGYNLAIDIASNGTVSSTEQRIVSGNNGTAITMTAYNKLYTQVRKRSSSTSRASLLENEFNNTNKTFTAKQASDLIQLVNSESLRFKLAKLSYLHVSDRENFSLVSSLLNSTSNRRELDDYIATIGDDDEDDDDTNNGNSTTPMNNAKFRTIYNEVMAETSNTDRNYYLSNFFNKDFNFYTSSQARQLIQLVTTEAERFYLAKVAYRGITDRANYNEVYQLLSSASNRAELTAYINTYDKTNATVAMSTTDFNRLYQSAYYQSSTSAKYSSINTAFTTPGYNFSVLQARQLIQLVTDEYSRLQLAKTSYAVLVDKYNYTQLNDLFTTAASRNELANYANNYNNNGGTVAGVAMSNAAFTTLYNNVNNSWSASNKFSLEADAFSSTTNYFSTSQVRQLLQLITAESDRLTLAKSSYDNVVDKTVFNQVYDLFTTTASRNELANYVNNYNNNGGTVGGVAMSDASFTTIYNNVNSAWNATARFNLESDAFSSVNNYFTVYQVNRLLLLISSESDRLTLAKLAFDNTVDQSNYSQLYSLFNTTSYRNDLADFVARAGYGVGTVSKVPMSESAFNTIYRDVQYTFGLGAKMSELTKIFNDETKYFTVQQAKKLIEMVSLESNRLDLAKSAYNNLTDPGNYAVLKELFSIQSSKDQLDAYVNSNAYMNN